MNIKDTEVAGITYCKRHESMKHHITFTENNRAYLCGCMPLFRVDGECKFASDRGWRFRSRMNDNHRWSG